LTDQSASEALGLSEYIIGDAIEMNISDCHIHFGKTDRIYHPFHSVDELLKHNEKYSIKNALILPFDQEIEETNQKILEMAKNHRGLYALYWIQRNRLKQDCKDIERAFKTNGFCKGIKFHGVFEQTPISDPVYESALELLNDYNALLLIHCGRFKEGLRESNTSYLHALDIAKKYPKITIILGHMGGGDTTIIKHCLNDAKGLSNIYYDTSGLTTPYALEYALRVVNRSKFLFGSDAPWCSFRSKFYNVEDAHIDSETKELILYENLRRLLK
jgi:predicted TIM-barrel fold metal-dependent hydrolase